MKCGLLPNERTSGFTLVYRNVRFGDVNELTWSLSLLASVCAWSPERLSTISSVAFWISMSCVGAATSRMMTLAKIGLVGPQYCGLAFISVCEVEMPDMTYGPLPADAVCR